MKKKKKKRTNEYTRECETVGTYRLNNHIYVYIYIYTHIYSYKYIYVVAKTLLVTSRRSSRDAVPMWLTFRHTTSVHNCIDARDRLLKVSVKNNLKWMYFIFINFYKIYIHVDCTLYLPYVTCMIHHSIVS